MLGGEARARSWRRGARRGRSNDAQGNGTASAPGGLLHHPDYGRLPDLVASAPPGTWRHRTCKGRRSRHVNGPVSVSPMGPRRAPHARPAAGALVGRRSAMLAHQSSCALPPAFFCVNCELVAAQMRRRYPRNHIIGATTARKRPSRRHSRVSRKPSASSVPQRCRRPVRGFIWDVLIRIWASNINLILCIGPRSCSNISQIAIALCPISAQKRPAGAFTPRLSKGVALHTSVSFNTPPPRRSTLAARSSQLAAPRRTGRSCCHPLPPLGAACVSDSRLVHLTGAIIAGFMQRCCRAQAGLQRGRHGIVPSAMERAQGPGEACALRSGPPALAALVDDARPGTRAARASWPWMGTSQRGNARQRSNQALPRAVHGLRFVEFLFRARSQHPWSECTSRLFPAHVDGAL